jgi:hypothetical protein
MMTQARNVDTGVAGCFQDGRPCGHFHRTAVDGDEKITGRIPSAAILPQGGPPL